MFGGDHLTRYGGVFLLHRFFHQLRLRRRFHESLRFAQRNNTHSIPEMVMALLYPMILGLGRVEMTDLLRRNGVFQTLTGLPAYPDPTALRRFLRRFATRGLPKLRRLHDQLLTQLWQRPRPLTRVLFDLDSTVLTVYGRREQARIRCTYRASVTNLHVWPQSVADRLRDPHGPGHSAGRHCDR